MCKGKLAVVCLVAVSLLLVSGITGTADAGIISGCFSYWQLHITVPAPFCGLFVCPQGDTASFIAQGWWIWICVIDITGQPIPAIPPTDFWLVDCDPLSDAALCAGSASSNADSMTNAQGMTTMSLGGLTGGGCADGMALIVQNFVVLDSVGGCAAEDCKPIILRSPDIDGSLEVNLVDLSIFAASFPPQPYDPCCDFDVNAVVNLQDLSRFAFHFGPPGHICN
jgi:hypothetical protein